jgi:predicted Zn-dependent protease
MAGPCEEQSGTGETAMTATAPPPTHAAARRFLAGLVMVVAVGCGPVSGPGGGPGHRPQGLGLTPEQEYRLGVEAYEEILRQARREDGIVRTGPQADQVRTVGQRIADVATGPSEMSRLLRREMNVRVEGYRYDWEFAVLRNDQVNAFCLPGGKVAVFTGLFRATDGSDEMLAVVLGHEIAHALAHHASGFTAKGWRPKP